MICFLQAIENNVLSHLSHEPNQTFAISHSFAFQLKTVTQTIA